MKTKMKMQLPFVPAVLRQPKGLMSTRIKRVGSSLTKTATIAGIVVASTIASKSAVAQTIGAAVDETNIQQHYYISATGSDNNSGTSTSPFATLSKAISTARYGSLSQGQKTKIWVAEGTYTTGYGAGLGWNETWPGSGRDTTLIIEGQGTNGPTFSGMTLYFPNKCNLVLRKLKVTGGGGNWGPTGAGVGIDGSAYKTYTIRNVLLDNVQTIGNNGEGINILHCHNVTLKNCLAKDNKGEGMLLQGRWNRSENCTVTGNNFSVVPTDQRGGFYFVGQDCIVDGLVSTGNRGTGMRCDFQAKNVTFRNCKLNNNFGVYNGTGGGRDAMGMMFEIVDGPVNIINCEMIGNSGSGISISTSHNLTLDGCTIKDNVFSQLEIISNDNRKDGVLYTDTQWYPGWIEANGTLTQANNRVISKVVNMVVKNSTLTTTKGPTSRIYWNENNGDEGYTNWAVNEFTGSKNTYFNSVTTNAFLRNRDEYVDFAAWKAWTGTDSDSSWGAATSTPTPTPTPAVVNLASNPGFEAEQYGTQTPSGWSEWSGVGGNGSSYTESVGGSNSGNYHLTHNSSATFNMYTFQNKTGLTNGLYTFRARVKTGNTNGTRQLVAKNFGGTTKVTSIPANLGSYTPYEVKDINVTNGTCEIGFWSDGSAWCWTYFDDVEFFKQ